MPFNGAGAFSVVYNFVADAAAGIKILASRQDTQWADVASNGLSNVICKDGQTTITANIPFSGFKATGLGDATTAGDALTYGTGTHSSSLAVPSRQIFLSGTSATYTTPTGCRELRVRMVGGGGGGGGTNATPTYVAGSAGGTSSFNSITAVGGAGGGQNGGAGGTGGAGSANLRFNGCPGLSGTQYPDTNAVNPPGGIGGSSPFGYPAAPTNSAGTASSAAANTGAGGNGAVNGTTHLNSAAGGGGSEYVEIIITSPSATYTYTVGTGGAGGVSTVNGGAGGSGIIIVDEYY